MLYLSVIFKCYIWHYLSVIFAHLRLARLTYFVPWRESNQIYRSLICCPHLYWILIQSEEFEKRFQELKITLLVSVNYWNTNWKIRYYNIRCFSRITYRVLLRSFLFQFLSFSLKNARIIATLYLPLERNILNCRMESVCFFYSLILSKTPYPITNSVILTT